jgi:hypothetical protein
MEEEEACAPARGRALSRRVSPPSSQVIAEYMRYIMADESTGEQTFALPSIVTPRALGVPDGTSVENGKPRMLELLCKRLGVDASDRAAVMFFDDDGANVEECRRSGFTNAFHLPGGFSRASLLEVDKSAGFGSSAKTCSMT